MAPPLVKSVAQRHYNIMCRIKGTARAMGNKKSDTYQHTQDDDVIESRKISPRKPVLRAAGTELYVRVVLLVTIYENVCLIHDSN